MKKVYIIAVLIILVIIIAILSKESFDETDIDETKINSIALNNIVDIANKNEIKSKDIIADNVIKSKDAEIEKAQITNANINNLSSSNATINNLVLKNSLVANGAKVDTLSVNGDLTSRNTKYIYDTNAEIWFCKDNEGKPIGDFKFKCIAYGFYDTVSQIAIVNTSYFSGSFNHNKDKWWEFIKIVINNVAYYAIKYDFLNANNGTSIAQDKITSTKPYLAGKLELSENQYQIWNKGTDIANTWYARLHPITRNVNADNKNYPVYILKDLTDGGGHLSWNLNNFVMKITDLVVTTKYEPY